MEDTALRKIDTLFHTNRDKFLKEMRRKRKQDENVNVPIDELKRNFEKLFNERNQTNLNKTHDEILLELNSYEKEINESINTELIEVPPEIIKRIIADLPNGKSSGFVEAKNEMFKYGCIYELSIIIANIIKAMIKFNQIPYLFNVGKILPILKKNDGPNDEINNIRPITISDTIANVFEKYLPTRIEGNHQDPKDMIGKIDREIWRVHLPKQK
ncbi:unnamed protein product [Brachionus calyciflorus]|uniref:Uncharacterized protein n=1 Tax=Brachionus calyciflorus TaxID=104777 RepID=A0A814FLX8_9BILA|nr:unnamed protein product [Brachionus calyciflorus]